MPRVLNLLNAQRREGMFCDIILKLDAEERDDAASLKTYEAYGHYCVIGAQSELIGATQPSVQNPLRVLIKNFSCVACLVVLMDYFYDEQVVSVSREHEPHFRNLVKILHVTELLELFDTQKEEHEIVHIEDAVSVFDPKPNYFKLKNPRATASNSKINYCHGCDFKCYRVQEMLNHMSTCTGSHLTCSLCEVGFTNWHEYEAHLRKHSMDVKKPFFCLECDVRFMTRAALMVHHPKHSAETPHLCSHCGKKFKWIQGLRSHQLIHKEKKMLCDVCGYSTTHMKALKSHKLQHTGEFFKCTYPGCKHRANRKENLKLHIETHKQERPFVCEVCGCKFSLSKNLKRHALKHATDSDGGKKYKCQLCTFCSHRTDKLREHVQRIHTEKVMQLELTETVENSFENKTSDDEFNLPEVLATNHHTESPSAVHIPIATAWKTLRKSAPAIERRLRPLAPKSVHNGSKNRTKIPD